MDKLSYIPKNCRILEDRVLNEQGKIAVVYGRNCHWYSENKNILSITHPWIVNIVLGRYGAFVSGNKSLMAILDQALYDTAKLLFGEDFKVYLGNELSITWVPGQHFILSKNPTPNKLSEMLLIGIGHTIFTIDPHSNEIATHKLAVYADNGIEPVDATRVERNKKRYKSSRERKSHRHSDQFFPKELVKHPKAFIAGETENG